MKKCLKKAISSILASAMLFSSVAVVHTSALAANFGSVGGWFESIYAEIPGIEDADVTGVSYSGTMNGSLSGEDLQYLVRDYNGGVRIDIPGLQAGNYTLTVNTSEGTVTKNNISVMEYDRSGYAHFNYDEGVGAYNNNGTLKDKAIVLYVTEDNKNDVTLTYNGKTVTGIGNILNSRGAKSSGGSLINSNQGILEDLATDGVPLVVRIVGEVKAGDSNTSNNPPSENINGLTEHASENYGGSEDDDGMMARIEDAKDITVEGIGADASINGWGIHFVCGTAAYKAGLGKSCEIRNIYFQNYPEDAFGAEGQQEGSTLSAPVERIWVHNNNFGPGYCKNPTDSDKSEGDGSCDFKRGQYYTMAYNKYWDCHKTNLVGSSDSSLQYFMSMHHNYYENCMARGPLARQGNIHMYNNVYIGQTDYAMNTRANAYIFSESNLFYMCKNPMRVDAGAIKSYNDSLSACIEEMGGTVVTDKNQKVSSGNKYENFDTDPSLSYIPGGDYIVQEDVTEAKKVVMAYAGVMKENVITPDEASTSLVEPGKQPSASVVLPYKKDLNSTYITKGTQTKDNIYFSAYKAAGDSISIKEGQAIVFNVNTNANIKITDGGATYPVVLMNDSGVEYLTGSGTAYNVPAGTYFIQPGGFSPAKNGGEPSYKESKITFLGIEAYDPTAPTVTEPTTQTTTEGYTETTTKVSGGEDEPDTEETTEGIPGDPVVMGTYNFGKNASGGDFNVTEKKSTAGNMEIELRDMSSDGARLRKDDGYIGISFTLTQEAEITISYDNRGIEIYNTETGETITFERGESPQSTVLEPGKYSISGNDTKNNSTVSQIILKALETTTETTTEGTTVTETTTEETTVTESSSETTTEEEPAPEPSDKVYGDVNGNGALDINDASDLIDMVLNGAVDVIDGITDVTGDGKVDTADIATILQKILDDGWKMPCELADEDATEATTEDVSEDTTEPVNADSFYDFNDYPAVTKDGTDGIVYTVSTASGKISDGLTAEAVIVDKDGSPALYLHDASKTDTVKATLPLTEKSSGVVTYTVKLNPSTNGGNWTLVQFNGVSADDVEGEVLGVRTDKNKNYGLRVNGGSTVTSSGVAMAADTTATVTVVVDFDNDTATISVNGSAPVTVTGVDAKSITSISFQTATNERNLYVDDAGIQ